MAIFDALRSFASNRDRLINALYIESMVAIALIGLFAKQAGIILGLFCGVPLVGVTLMLTDIIESRRRGREIDASQPQQLELPFD